MAQWVADYGVWGLFFSAFISSTLLPGGSELALAYLLEQSSHAPGLLLLAASAGNTLGGMSSWLIGWLIARRWALRALDKPEHQKAVDRLQKWGSPVLLLSWLPVIGDPLCLMAGWMKIGVWRALFFIAIGKVARYAVIVYALT